MRVLGLALTLALNGWILAGCASQGVPGAGELSFAVVKVYGGHGWIGKENRVPTDILLDEKEGRFYVVQWRDSYVKKFRMDGTFIDWLGESNAWDKTFSSPYGIAAGDGDHLFLTLDGESTVFVMTRAGEKVKALFQEGSGPGDLNRPKGIARSPKNGWFYVVDRYNFRVRYFDAEGNVKGQWGSRGSGPGEFYLARGIAIDANGDVYVADTYNHRVQVFTADGRFLRAFGAPAGGENPLKYPSGIALSKDGLVFVTDTGYGRIAWFTKDGTFRGVWGRQGCEPGQFNQPLGIAVDSAGRLWVADTMNHRVQILERTGGAK